MNQRCCAVVYLTGLLWVVSAVSLGQEAPIDYGQAVVDNVVRVNSQCWIICDITDWPAVIGKEMPVQIRGLEPQPTPEGYDLSVRQFIMETLTHALTQTPSANDPNKPAQPIIQLKHIQRAKDFCLIADVEVNGRDLAGILVDKGYAKKLIIPKTTPVTPAAPAAAANTTIPAPAAQGGFVTSKSGKVFHKPTCPHAKRIQDNTKVTYQTREEAVASGRRPCQTCNP
jgi:hypothetical protein